MTAAEVKAAVLALLNTPITKSELVAALNQMIDYTGSFTAAWSTWDSTVTYSTTNPRFAVYLNRLWMSKVNSNLNHQPPSSLLVTSDTYWQEVSPGTSFVEWASGSVYGSGLVIVFFDATGNDPSWYLLRNATRPYYSTDLVAETDAGDWQKLGGTERTLLNTSGGTITLDMVNAKERMFIGNTNIATAKTWANVAHVGNALKFLCKVNITTVGIQSFPSNWLMAKFVGEWDDGAKQWTPSATGKYEIEGSFDGFEWLIKINGPF